MSTSLQIDTNLTVPASHAHSSAKPSPLPSNTLTTFPNPFEDEPEQGILPSFLSKVKQTFASSSNTSSANSPVENVKGKGLDKGSLDITTSSTSSVVPGYNEVKAKPHQTEAQAIAEAVRKGAQQAALAASSRAQHASQQSQYHASTSASSDHGQIQARRQSSGHAIIPTIQPISVISESSRPPAAASTASSSTQITSPKTLPAAANSRSLRPPLSTVNSVGSATSSLQSPSISSSSHSNTHSHAPSRRFQAPTERQWKPSLAAPAQVTISPVTSVTTTVQAASSSRRPQTPETTTPFPAGPGRPRAHFNIQPPTIGNGGSGGGIASSRSITPLQHHAHVNSQNLRVRRSSIATLPDSPSSISISTMLASNAELSKNFNYVPGFPLNQDDSRSIRSVALGGGGFGAFVKKQNSVSKIIRRMRGEGLSKHYWMADESCKECYDCKSVFTAWRRKHHCRICGQIFCSRCASNIIGARRFGQEGAVRVCNLCLKIMEEYRDDDEDDRRSINSVSTSVHRFPSISDRAFLDASISPEVPYAKSPFAASQLFTSHPNESLTAIDESSVPTRWRGDRDYDGPYTPVEMGDGSQHSDSEDAHIWASSRPQTAAPFRRPMEEDQKSNHVAENEDEDVEAAPRSNPSSPENTANATDRRAEPPKMGDMGPPAVPMPPRVEFPRTDTMSTDGGLETRVPLARMDSNAPLIGLRTRLSSRASQGGLTALLDSEKTEGLWRARSHSFAQRPEMLSGASLGHFHLMLQQAIARAELPNAQQWHRTLSHLLLKVSTNLQPNVRAGDDIDVRAYVKIKKVPGGKISDSEYVDGIVISKNVAHKAMPRRLVNPRIMVVTFPLDYHRVENQFMSLDPILAQEKDYLRLLTKRIIDVRPHIVLVQPSASRIALEYLLEANIAVARSVKVSAIHQVARCTQADVVASMDRLALEPRLGRCSEFRIQSFEHELIPGRRKTLMRFEGGHREHGCTIILRGGDLATLRKVKIVTDFMALVVYHLKNEIILYNDEHNIFPPHPALPAEYQDLLEVLNEVDPAINEKSTPEPAIIQVTDVDGNEEPLTPKPVNVGKGEEEDEKQVERREALQITKQIAESLQPYLQTVLSASAAIRFPPPATLAKMAELDRSLANLRQSIDDEEAAQILQEESKRVEPTKTVSPATEMESSSSSTTLVTSVVDSSESGNTEMTSTTAMSAIPLVAAPTKESARDPYRVLRKPEEVSRESALSQVAHDHSEQLKLWQWYTRRFIEPLRAEDYQGIVYLYSLGCEGTDKPCVEPALQTINFYQPDDRTLGQFLEDLAINAAQRCTSKTCERLLLFHFHLLVHGERRLQIAMDQFPCPSPGHEDQIITWSYCRLCATPSPTTILREETWKMSWGSYLEHCFYPPETRAGFTCPHDAFRDQIRYFAHRNLAIRIHNESVDIYEPQRPSIRLQVRAETKVVLKNQEYESALHKNTAFFDSVLFRLRSFDTEICQPEKIGSLKTALESMLSRAVADREEMVNLLNRTYKLTPMTDVLALNMVLRTLQDKVVQWDSDFAEMEKTFMPSEKDLRRMTATHLKRLFANQDVFNSLDRNVASLTVSEADEKEVKDVSTDTTPAPSEPVTPGLSSVDTESTSLSTEPPTLDLNQESEDVITPMGGLLREEPNPLSQPPTPAPEREYDSDSTISAIRRDSPERSPMGRVESSGVDSDAHQFVSRLPRRSRPAPSIADLVQRFNDATKLQPFVSTESPERPESSGSMRRKGRRSPHPEASDSDHSHKARPRLRRGRTEQPPVRYREVNKPSGLLSDGDRSYAANASRIPSTFGRKRSVVGQSSDHLRPGLKSRTPSYTGRVSPHSPRSTRTSPERPQQMVATSSNSAAHETKPRMSGKGKTPSAPDQPSGRTSPSLIRTAARRTLASSSRVTSIARHFDRLSREAERERQKRISMVRGKRARPVGVTKAKVQVFDNLRDAFRDESDTDSSEADNEEDEMGSDDSAEKSSPTKSRSRKSSPTKAPTPLEPIPVKSSISTESIPEEGSKTDEIPIAASGASLATQSVLSDARSEMSFTDRLQIELPSFETSAPLPSHPVTPQLSTDTADELPKGPQHPTMSQMSQMSESELSSGGVERSSILKTLTGLWAFRAGDFTPLEYPLSASEHLFADSRVIIRENEPTSIIAFTLSSKTYRDKMRAEANQSKAGTGGKTEAFMPEDHHHGQDRASTWDIVSMDEAMDNDGDLRREGGTHLKYDFESGASTIFCRIFFAEQFAALRSACQCEDSFVESLARCVQFDASGGKSGSAFLKTKDDRFIAKEISRLEMDALTKFAPAYFEYTRKAFQGQRPSVLAKIYGFFKIGYRNAITGRYMRMNVLVMENLFYERRFSKIYDLKGSTRNRLIQATGRTNEVLLDENLMEIVYKHPLYLRDHSKRILRTALFNDTLFLSNLNVMDYSLVVGVDSERHELVVGIVDYIRTFTWDKKLESWVKDSAFLGGAGKGEPTIVTPKQYKLRFRTAMERFYFPSVPDRWTKVGIEEVPVEEDGQSSIHATI
uniref:1-phosphatidylinositol-3-phosphate 5-kinase n=1 Tax=Kwoniella dejecticola CBS 10117 TaxID=1296121 RepID=A0A1A6A3D0_9TREE|nr:1-phosphatidylinositol-3-phosphate 5-kinase [Kwoniella dejecticola CBS 10117]OBR84559.1 1-phosphatidylinositol-3-phosphate 5-kinase [Kwoniella dejecticola CBS 10117]